MNRNINRLLLDLWARAGLSGPHLERLNAFAALLLFAAAMTLIAFVSKIVFVRLMGRLVKKTKTAWDDCLAESRFFIRLSRLIPVSAAYPLMPLFVAEDGLSRKYGARIILAALSFVTAAICAAFLDGVNLIYQNSAQEAAKRKPIKGYIQLIKVFLYIIGAIMAITFLADVSPFGILGGIGAMSAVLLLIFKDSILGFVSGIQLSSNDMVRIGDWIEMPGYNADGSVIDINLHSVKVQNWDKTISNIPIYALVSGSFKNWRGMSEAGGRRIKRAIRIDMNSVHFLTDAEIAHLSRIKLIEDYMRDKLADISAYNKEHEIAEGDDATGRRLTNLGTYRAYAERYIQSLPFTAKDMACAVRYLPPDENGLQMEFYLFSADTVWLNYEHYQADIIDHLLASMSHFNLRVYQSVSGSDIRLLAGAAGEVR